MSIEIKLLLLLLIYNLAIGKHKIGSDQELVGESYVKSIKYSSLIEQCHFPWRMFKGACFLTDKFRSQREALIYCINNGGYLYIVRHNHDILIITEIIKNEQFNRKVWIYAKSIINENGTVLCPAIAHERNLISDETIIRFQYLDCTKQLNFVCRKHLQVSHCDLPHFRYHLGFCYETSLIGVTPLLAMEKRSSILRKCVKPKLSVCTNCLEIKKRDGSQQKCIRLRNPAI
ncbi:hypothetical protein GJ496_007009 [Pomphorhynchus laevis]|nr:hypothetical protein GJ496_007009 [Pomphorhynchus laevis]